MDTTARSSTETLSDEDNDAQAATERLLTEAATRQNPSTSRPTSPSITDNLLLESHNTTASIHHDTNDGVAKKLTFASPSTETAVGKRRTGPYRTRRSTRSEAISVTEGGGTNTIGRVPKETMGPPEGAVPKKDPVIQSKAKKVNSRNVKKRSGRSRYTLPQRKSPRLHKDNTNTGPVQHKDTETKHDVVKQTEITVNETKPTDTKEVETERVETKEVETKPSEIKQADTEQSESKDTNTDPIKTKEAETEQSESKDTNTKTTESKEVDTEQSESKEAETGRMEIQEADTKPVETKETSTEQSESKEADTEQSETKETNTEQSESKDTTTKPSETKQAGTEQSERKYTNTDPIKTKEVDTEQCESKEAETGRMEIQKAETEQSETKDTNTETTGSKETETEQSETKDPETGRIEIQEADTKPVETKETETEQRETKDPEIGRIEIQEGDTKPVQTKETSTGRMEIQEAESFVSLPPVPVAVLPEDIPDGRFSIPTRGEERTIQESKPGEESGPSQLPSLTPRSCAAPAIADEEVPDTGRFQVQYREDYYKDNSNSGNNDNGNLSDYQYREELAWRFHNENRALNWLRPLPPPPPDPDFPTGISTSCRWSFDPETRVVLANFRSTEGSVVVSQSDKERLYRLMERDDVTLITEGLADRLDPQLWDLEYIMSLVGSEYYYRFRRFTSEIVEPPKTKKGKKRKANADEDGGSGGGIDKDKEKDKNGSPTTTTAPSKPQKLYREVDGYTAMKGIDYLNYLKARKESICNGTTTTAAATETTVTTRMVKELFHYIDPEGKQRSFDPSTEILYMIDYDMERKLPCVFADFLNKFALPECMPGGSRCMMNSVRGLCPNLCPCRLRGMIKKKSVVEYILICLLQPNQFITNTVILIALLPLSSVSLTNTGFPSR